MLAPGGVFAFSSHNTFYRFPAPVPDPGFVSRFYPNRTNAPRPFRRYKVDVGATDDIETYFPNPFTSGDRCDATASSLAVGGKRAGTLRFFEAIPHYVARVVCGPPTPRRTGVSPAFPAEGTVKQNLCRRKPLRMAARTESRKGRSYTFRRYEPGDEEGFLDLFERVWGERRSEEWVRWRFEANPYMDHVPMFVAESGGAVVGTRPFLAFRMAVGDGTALALLTVDTMVHPDHRRRGLFTTMTEQALEYYAEREPAFVFNQPNADARPGYRSLGFRELDPMRTYYRVQRPSAFDDRLGVPGATAVSRVADGLVTGYHRLREGGGGGRTT